jgi:hypothetical protein
MPEHRAQVWDAKTLQLAKTLERHSQAVSSVQYSGDGTRLVTGSWDGTAIVWDSRALEPLITVAHKQAVEAVDLDERGETLATATRFEVAPQIHPLNERALLELARSRTIRWFNDQECKKYLERPCPHPGSWYASLTGQSAAR